MGKQWKQWQTVFLGSKITADGDYSHELKRCLLPGRRTMTNLLLLLLSRFSHGQLCATPQAAAHRAPLSLGFSRQEHWSELPFPSPMHERKSESEVALSCLTLATPWTAAYQAPPSMGFSKQEYWSGGGLTRYILFIGERGCRRWRP